MRTRTLLWCGIASSLLYVAINVIVPLQWEGYSLLSQAPSELSAIDSPTRRLWNIVCAPYTPLVMLFGWGVWRAAADSSRMRVAGLLVGLYGALGLGWPFFPMHLREVIAAGGGDYRDQMHLVFAGVTVALMFLAMTVAAVARAGAFRRYTVASIVGLLTFGALTAREAAKIDQGLPTPLLGFHERVNIGVFLVWIVVLAVTLMRDEARRGTAEV